MKDKELEKFANNHALNVGTPSSIRNIHQVIESKRLACIAGARFERERILKTLRDVSGENPPCYGNDWADWLEAKLSDGGV